MRIPNPIANTTTEAYLAYKAGVLAAGDLKPKLYFPYLHFDAWLAYWAGLTSTYPIHDVGKNLFDKDDTSAQKTGLYIGSSTIQGSTGAEIAYIKCLPNTTYTVSKVSSARFACATTQIEPANGVAVSDRVSNPTATSITITTSATAKYIVVFYYLASADTKTKEEVLNSIQIEEGSTATPYEPYTGTPECLTDEEALVAYLSGVTNTYPDTVKDPEDVRIAGYLRYLVSARFGCPAYPVNNRELYLSMLKPPVVTNDTPSANIYLEDTVKAEFVSLEMYGDTSQQTYTGKNLLKVPTSGTYETKGLKTTYQSDGSMVITGTPTDTWATVRSWTGVGGIIPAGTYTISVYGPSGAQIEIQLYEGSTAHNYFLSGGSHETVTLGYSVSATTLILSNLTVGTSVNTTVMVQIEAGSSSTDYEPYVGGIPAPNPDYPQAVQTVTGEQEIFITGKNLLDSSRYNAEADGLTNKLNADGTITTTGIPTKNYVRIISDTDITDMLEDGQTYTCSETEGAPEHVVAVQVRALKRTGGYDYYLGSFTVDKTTHESYQIAAQTGTMEQWGSESRTITCGYQLEKGSVATDFEPYRGRQQYIINLNGKNLFDKANANTFAGTVGTSSIAPGGSNKILYIPCLPEETYTIQKRNDGNTNRFAVATTHDLPEGGVVVTGMIQQNNASSITITTAANARYLVIMYYRTQETVVTEQQVLDSIQIEEGPVATEYEPFHGNIELCKIGDYQDYIYNDGQDWILHKETASVEMGKIGGWAQGSGNQHWQLKQNFGSLYGAVSGVGYTNIFIYGGTTWTYDHFGIAASGNLWVGTTEAMVNPAAFVSYLKAHNAVMYYALATPTNTTITNPTLIAQLDALAGGNSYDTTTYITVTSAGDNLPGLLKVEAGTESVS